MGDDSIKNMPVTDGSDECIRLMVTQEREMICTQIKQ